MICIPEWAVWMCAGVLGLANIWLYGFISAARGQLRRSGDA